MRENAEAWTRAFTALPSFRVLSTVDGSQVSLPWVAIQKDLQKGPQKGPNKGNKAPQLII